MIIILHPRATKPKNRRFPLAALAIAAVLEGKEEYVIVDGNVDPQPERTLDRIMQRNRRRTARRLRDARSADGGRDPAVPRVRRKYPRVPVVWGGYFPSLYADATLNAPYVDFAVRGQGEDTFLELLAALRGSRKFGGIRGLSYKDDFGLHVHNAERPLRSPDDFPWPPYHRLINPEKYILPTFLGRRTAVHHASIGCPFRCKFCGVVPVHEGRERLEAPARTAAILAHLQREYAIDAVQFYDNNFFLNESHAREQAERLTPLGLRWWAEGRVDAVLRYSDETLRALRRSGATMIFFGAESGSDKVLAEMNKRITSSQTLELAARIRQFGIVPEFSFVFGNPADPAGDTRDTIRVHPPYQETESGRRDHCAALHSHPASRRHVRRSSKGRSNFPRRRTNGPASAGTTSPYGTIRACPGYRRPSRNKSTISSWWSIRAGQPSRIFICRAGDATCSALSACGATRWEFTDFRLSCSGRSVWCRCANRVWRAFECASRPSKATGNGRPSTMPVPIRCWRLRRVFCWSA